MLSHICSWSEYVSIGVDCFSTHTQHTHSRCLHHKHLCLVVYEIIVGKKDLTVLALLEDKNVVRHTCNRKFLGVSKPTAPLSQNKSSSSKDMTEADFLSAPTPFECRSQQTWSKVWWRSRKQISYLSKKLNGTPLPWTILKIPHRSPYIDVRRWIKLFWLLSSFHDIYR